MVTTAHRPSVDIATSCGPEPTGIVATVFSVAASRIVALAALLVGDDEQPRARATSGRLFSITVLRRNTSRGRARTRDPRGVLSVLGGGLDEPHAEASARGTRAASGRGRGIGMSRLSEERSAKQNLGGDLTSAPAMVIPRRHGWTPTRRHPTLAPPSGQSAGPTSSAPIRAPMPVGRQPDGERRSLPQLALDLDRRADQLRERLHDRQAETGPAELAARRAVALLERLEHLLPTIAGMPTPVSRTTIDTRMATSTARSRRSRSPRPRR